MPRTTKHATPHSQAGFTLTELLATIAVAAILAGLAAPAFNNFIKNERIIAEANDVIAAFYLARTEAVRRNRRVTICPSDNPLDEKPQCSTASDGSWTRGYIIFTDGNPVADRDADGKFNPDDTEVLLRVRPPFEGVLTLSTDDALIKDYVSFIPRGLPRTLRTPGSSIQNQEGVLRLCDDRGSDNMRAVVLSKTGRVRILAEEAAQARAKCKEDS